MLGVLFAFWPLTPLSGLMARSLELMAAPIDRFSELYTQTSLRFKCYFMGLKKKKEFRETEFEKFIIPGNDLVK
jgi:hypothetical protein